MFDTTKEDLRDILKRAEDGTLQLPDFQRDYVWNDDDIQSLIASVAKGFPIGALLTLETGGSIEFKPRLLAGVPPKDIRPNELLLDGQQRITSLYQVTYSKAPVVTRTAKRKEVERLYYLDIAKCVESGADISEAIVPMPADRILRSEFGRKIEKDLSSPEKEYENDMFPLNRVFDSKDWFFGWRRYWDERGRNVIELEWKFDREVVDGLSRYKMPIIRLDRHNSREAICLVFEKVNVGGKKLDPFELVTAVYAADNFNLRDDWNGTKTEKGRLARIIGYPNRRDVLTELNSTDFLQACSLLHTRAIRLARAEQGSQGKELPRVSCNRESVLALPLSAYRQYADAVEKGFIEAAGFLNEHKIIWHKDVSYPPLIMALASLFAIMGKEAQSASAKEKLSRWFWSIILGELYGSATDSRIARDVPEVVDWLRGSSARPRSMDEAIFQQDRLRSLRMRISAAYKGIHALLMRQGCRDFITGRPTDLMTFFNDRIDIHHIFPAKWCQDRRVSPNLFNSIVNKTALSRLSNQFIGGQAPSIYLARIEQKHGLTVSQLDDILRSHLIEPQHLRNDDFEAFFRARMQALCGLVGEAMGKPVAFETGTNEPERDVPDDTEDELETDLDDQAAA